MEFANGIMEEGKRVAKIVRNLLAFARQEKDEVDIMPFRDILENTLSLLGSVLRKNQIDLKLDILTEFPPIRCKSQQIQQVIMNLLTNAMFALNERYQGFHENKQVSISIQRLIEDGKYLQKLSITDHGVGISQENRDRIFDPFFTTKSRLEGTGLGLSVSYGIIKDHNGRIEVQSEVNSMTCFSVYLPEEDGMDSPLNQG